VKSIRVGSFSVMMAALITLLSAVGCAPEAAPTTPNTPTTPSAPITPTTPSQPTTTPIEWVGSMSVGEGTLPYEHMKETGKVLEQVTGGRLKWVPYPAGAIVPATGCFDGVNDGVLDYSIDPSAFWTDRVGYVSGLLCYVTGLTTPMDMLMWWDAGGWELARRAVEGYPNMYLSKSPGQCRTAETFLWTNEPINSVADVKAMTIRSVGDSGVFLQEMGVATLPIPPGEIYESMQRGILDGFELGSPAIDVTYTTWEMAKYAWIGDRQPAEHEMFFINRDSWNALTPELQALVEQVVYARAVQYNTAARIADLEAMALFESKGVIVQRIPSDVEAALKQAANAVYDRRAADDAFYAEVLSSIRDTCARYRETWPRL